MTLGHGEWLWPTIASDDFRTPHFGCFALSGGAGHDGLFAPAPRGSPDAEIAGSDPRSADNFPLDSPEMDGPASIKAMF